ncbi:hypothetical protein D187_008819 [Cystobacter fuscus DSM 2262]|uniref:Lipoprotein n=1 Tax=Cystobacter fuscus (strain ATCC 25194 / DSM 2262 / NBRC 100088 / M29) TaxID=1242864 RepID=S9PHW9_CYSF2|nr:hypothetical protein D187_008819 [Cystobacter fuscus DSM 2262]
MATRLTAAVLLLALLSACATQRVVRLDTRQGEPLEYKLPTSPQSVKVDAEAFEEVLTHMVLNAPLTLRPLQHGGLVLASYPGNDEAPRWQRLMSKRYGGLCEPGQRMETCLSPLDDVMGLSEWDKLGVALGLSIDPLKESIARAVEKTLAPQLFYTVIATGLVTWAVLAVNPEPVFTKAAAIVSALLLIYLGVETFLEVVDASRELKWASDRAMTWEELEHASKRFAHRVGPEVARVFVLAVTVVMSHGMTGGSAWLASRLSMLPNVAEAAALGAEPLRLTLSEIGQVSTVAVSAEGTITVILAPTAVAMTGKGPGGGSKQEQYKTPKSGVSGKEGAKDVPSWAKGERPKVDESGKDFAKRLLDKKYGEGSYDKGPGSEFNKIQKWGDRAFENP